MRSGVAQSTLGPAFPGAGVVSARPPCPLLPPSNLNCGHPRQCARAGFCQAIAQDPGAGVVGEAEPVLLQGAQQVEGAQQARRRSSRSTGRKVSSNGVPAREGQGLLQGSGEQAAAGHMEGPGWSNGNSNGAAAASSSSSNGIAHASSQHNTAGDVGNSTAPSSSNARSSRRSERGSRRAQHAPGLGDPGAHEDLQGPPLPSNGATSSSSMRGSSTAVNIEEGSWWQDPVWELLSPLEEAGQEVEPEVGSLAWTDPASGAQLARHAGQLVQEPASTSYASASGSSDVASAPRSGGRRGRPKGKGQQQQADAAQSVPDPASSLFQENTEEGEEQLGRRGVAAREGGALRGRTSVGLVLVRPRPRAAGSGNSSGSAESDMQADRAQVAVAGVGGRAAVAASGQQAHSPLDGEEAVHQQRQRGAAGAAASGWGPGRPSSDRPGDLQQQQQHQASGSRLGPGRRWHGSQGSNSSAGQGSEGPWGEAGERSAQAGRRRAVPPSQQPQEQQQYQPVSQSAQGRAQGSGRPAPAPPTRAVVRPWWRFGKRIAWATRRRMAKRRALRLGFRRRRRVRMTVSPTSGTDVWGQYQQHQQHQSQGPSQPQRGQGPRGRGSAQPAGLDGVGAGRPAAWDAAAPAVTTVLLHPAAARQWAARSGGSTSSGSTGSTSSGSSSTGSEALPERGSRVGPNARATAGPRLYAHYSQDGGSHWRTAPLQHTRVQRGPPGRYALAAQLRTHLLPHQRQAEQQQQQAGGESRGATSSGSSSRQQQAPLLLVCISASQQPPDPGPGAASPSQAGTGSSEESRDDRSGWPSQAVQLQAGGTYWLEARARSYQLWPFAVPRSGSASGSDRSSIPHEDGRASSPERDATSTDQQQEEQAQGQLHTPRASYTTTTTTTRTATDTATDAATDTAGAPNRAPAAAAAGAGATRRGAPGAPGTAPELHPARLLQRPVLLVADLAMVAGRQVASVVAGGADDAAAARFRAVWQRSQEVAPSMLVYTSHRCWRSFVQVWREKQRVLQQPDVLVLASGTRILYQVAGGSWQEDALWRASLDAGWDRGAVVRAVRAAAAAFNEAAAAGAALDAAPAPAAATAGAAGSNSEHPQQGHGQQGQQAGQQAAVVVVRPDVTKEQSAHRVRVLVRAGAADAFSRALELQLSRAAMAATSRASSPTATVTHQAQTSGAWQAWSSSGRGSSSSPEAEAGQGQGPGRDPTFSFDDADDVPGAFAAAAPPEPARAASPAPYRSSSSSGGSGGANGGSGGANGGARRGPLGWRVLVQPAHTVGLGSGKGRPSGVQQPGAWAAVDVVPAQAGEAAALRHVLAHFNIPCQVPHSAATASSPSFASAGSSRSSRGGSEAGSSGSSRRGGRAGQGSGASPSAPSSSQAVQAAAVPPLVVASLGRDPELAALATHLVLHSRALRQQQQPLGQLWQAHPRGSGAAGSTTGGGAGAGVTAGGGSLGLGTAAPGQAVAVSGAWGADAVLEGLVKLGLC